MMTHVREPRSGILLPTLLLTVIVILICGASYVTPVTLIVLDIRGEKKLIPINEGDELTHSYVHSMYQVPVSEKFILRDGRLKLTRVDTPNVSVLEYFGLTDPDVEHLGLYFDSFTTPAASVGSHTVQIRNSEVDVGTAEGIEGKISLSVWKTNNLFYYMNFL